MKWLISVSLCVYISVSAANAQTSIACSANSLNHVQGNGNTPDGALPTTTVGRRPIYVLVVFAQQQGDANASSTNTWSASTSTTVNNHLPDWGPYFVNPVVQSGSGTFAADGSHFMPGTGSSFSNADVGRRIYLDYQVYSVATYVSMGQYTGSITLTTNASFTGTHNFQTYDPPYPGSITDFCDAMSLKTELVIGQ